MIGFFLKTENDEKAVNLIDRLEVTFFEKYRIIISQMSTKNRHPTLSGSIPLL